MANDTDEWQALIEDHDDENIMQVEYMRNDIPSGNVVSPGQSDSSGRIEAGPGRSQLRCSSRRSSYSRSSTVHWPGTFDDDERPRIYEPTSRNTAPEDSAGAVVHKGKTYSGL
jgi:hypothetical protein